MLRVSFTIGLLIMGLSIVLLGLAAYLDQEEGLGYVAFWILMWPRLFLDPLLDHIFPRHGHGFPGPFRVEAFSSP